MKIEQTLFTYSHKIIHSTTDEILYNICFNQLALKFNAQLLKENEINNANKIRT